MAQSSINQKSLADEFGINQKVNLNININYSPTDAQFLSKKADPQNIDSNQSVSKFRNMDCILNFILNIFTLLASKSPIQYALKIESWEGNQKLYSKNHLGREPKHQAHKEEK